MRYTVVNKNVKAGFFADAEDKVEKKIQPFLDDGARKGWKLHSFSSSAASKGINLIFIWEHE